ncbi:MAG: formate dehydrogenase accessory sulfurtransferase FdhD [Acidimicrobiales bacterium]
MGHRRSENVIARRFVDGGEIDGGRRPEDVIVEEPLEIRLDGVTVATTMRTPGHDFELAAGWCFSEGLLGDAQIESCRYCATGSAVDTEFNVVSVDSGGRAPEPSPRLSTATSSCGICGSTQIEQLTERLAPLPAYEPWSVAAMLSVIDHVRSQQELFDRTGGVHAAAAFDRNGVPLLVREDIGRHNAVDKVIGSLLLESKLPARDHAIFVSGRASFDIVQKAWAAGFEAMIAVSAPSALAVETASVAGMTLVGFVRDGACNLYCGPGLSE